MATIDPPLISPSMRAAFKSCGRKVFYRYIAAIEPKRKSAALVMGTAFHKGLEHWRRAPGWQRAMDLPIAAACDELVDGLRKLGTSEEDITVYRAQLAAYLTGYAARFGAFDGVGQLVEVQAFSDDSDGETGFLDSVIEDEKGQRWIVEDKTAARLPDEPTMRMALRMNDQLLTYCHALAAKGEPVAGVRFRQTKKTQTWQTKKETVFQYAERIAQVYATDEECFREIVITFTHDELERYAKHKERDNLDVLQWLDVTDIERFPYNSSSCIGMYGPCEYLTLCAHRRDAAERLFQPNGKKAIDDGRFQQQIWCGSGSGAKVSSGETQERAPAEGVVSDDELFAASPGGVRPKASSRKR